MAEWDVQKRNKEGYNNFITYIHDGKLPVNKKLEDVYLAFPHYNIENRNLGSIHDIFMTAIANVKVNDIDSYSRVKDLFETYKENINSNKLNNYFVEALKRQITPLIVWLAENNATHKCVLTNYIIRMKTCDENSHECIQGIIDELFLQYNQTENIDCLKLIVDIGTTQFRFMNRELKLKILASEIANDDLEMVKYVIEKYNIDIHDKVLDVAAEYGNLNVIKYLITECGARISDNFEGALRNASQYGHLNVVKYLISEVGANMHTKNINISSQWTALENSVYYNHLEITLYLLKQSNKTDKFDKSFILYRAAAKGNLDIVKYLMENWQSELLDYIHKGFEEAVLNGHENIVKYLLDNKFIKISPYDKILVDASRLKHLNIVKLLLKSNKTDISILNKALGFAAYGDNKNIELMEILIMAGAEYYDNLNLLEFAIEKNQLNLIKILMKYYQYSDKDIYAYIKLTQRDNTRKDITEFLKTQPKKKQQYYI